MQDVRIEGETVKDYFLVSENTTKNFGTYMYGVQIENQGATDASVVVHGVTYPIKAGKTFNKKFEGFNTLTVNTTGACECFVMR
jgi:hypothetical protein